MELTEAKLSLLHTIAEALNERGIEATAENDSDSGELIIEFEGHTLILSSEDIVEDTDEEDIDEDETVACDACVKNIPVDEAITCDRS